MYDFNKGGGGNAAFAVTGTYYTPVATFVFLGFGLLMTYLKAHTWTGAAFSVFLGAWTMQIVLIGRYVWYGLFDDFVELDLSGLNIIHALYGAAAVLVSFSAVLGKVNSFQLIFFGLFHAIFYTLNATLTDTVYWASDVGGANTIHIFGASFGLAAAWILGPHGEKASDNSLFSSSKTSNMIAFIGTIFLFINFPTFNSILGGNGNYKMFTNTWIALLGSVTTAFVVSACTNNGKFKMTDALRATITGGIVAAGPHSMIIAPWLSLCLGIFVGLTTPIYNKWISPALRKYLKLHDSGFVLNLHLLPGIVASITTIIASLFAKDQLFGQAYSNIWARTLTPHFRSKNHVAFVQVGVLFTSMFLGIIGGAIAGGLLKIPKVWVTPEEIFNDDEFWAKGDNSDGD